HVVRLFVLCALVPPASTLFPYTTLFRSDRTRPRGGALRDSVTAPVCIRDDRNGHGRVTVVPRGWTAVGVAGGVLLRRHGAAACSDRKSTRLNSSHRTISYAVFCLKKKKN